MSAMHLWLLSLKLHRRCGSVIYIHFKRICCCLHVFLLVACFARFLPIRVAVVDCASSPLPRFCLLPLLASIPSPLLVPSSPLPCFDGRLAWRTRRDREPRDSSCSSSGRDASPQQHVASSSLTQQLHTPAAEDTASGQAKCRPARRTRARDAAARVHSRWLLFSAASPRCVCVLFGSHQQQQHRGAITVLRVRRCARLRSQRRVGPRDPRRWMRQHQHQRDRQSAVDGTVPLQH